MSQRPASLPSPSPTPTPTPSAPAAPARAAGVAPVIAQNARAFEAVFLGQMTQLMMSSVEQQGDFSGGNGAEMFRGILAEQVGTAIAARGGIGLAPAVVAQMIRMQGDTGNAR